MVARIAGSGRQPRAWAGGRPAARRKSTDPAPFRACLFKPRGWGWVDPTKEVEAFKEAVRAGFTTTSRVIAATADGADIEDIITERKREIELFEAAGINVDTDVPDEVLPAPAAKPAEPKAEEDAPARVVNLRK